MARYIVVGVTGYPASQSWTTSSKKGTSYSVLDTEWAYREVGQFYVGGGVTSKLQKERAERFCADLNRRDRAHLSARGGV